MELNFQTGLQEYDLNGKVKVAFNPSDTEFVKKLYSTFTELESVQKQYEEESKDIPEDDPVKIFEFADRKDKEMKGLIDTFFGKEVCGPLFGPMSVYSFNQDGIPVWMALFLVILDQCEEAKDKIAKAGNSTVNKYIDKYKKYSR